MKTRSCDPSLPGEEDMSAYSDEQLVLEALDDSHPAFQQLVEQYQYRVLKTIASIIGNDQAAQDVAQETFLSAWSDLSKLKEREKFGRWLNRIAINLSKDWLRDQRKYNENRIALDENTLAPAQELTYQRDKLRQEVWEAIDGLMEDHREVVTLHYISGYTYKEISEMLSVPVSTVQGRLQKARNQLRKEFLGMVRELRLEVDPMVHRFLKERAKRDGLSIEGLILRLIQRYKRDIDNPEVAVRQVWEPSREPVISDFCGAPSPDGRYLSFTDWWNQGNLAVRDLTTGECRDLTGEATWDEPDQWTNCSRWSPDGAQIAYNWCNEGPWELRIVGLDGSEPRVLYRSESKKVTYIYLHAWSQDGESILMDLKKPNGTNEIALISVADGSVRVLKTLKGLHQWHWMSLSPDARCVVYDRPVEEHNGLRDIFLLATDGSGEEVPLVEHPADDYGPAWAPDGKSIVFSSDRSGAYDAWLMQMAEEKSVGEPQLIKRDTGQMQPMGFTREGSFYYGLRTASTDVYTASIDPVTGELLDPPAKAIRRFEGFNHSPAWSPDGTSLAYVSMRPPSGSSGRKPVLVIRSEETGEERELHPEVSSLDNSILPPNLLWSPDGSSVLCGRWLQLIDVQTGDVTPIIQFDSSDRIGILGAAWSPDGKAVFYVRKVVQTGQCLRSIVAHDLETGKEKELCQGDITRPGLAFSPDGRQLAFAEGCSLKVMPAAGGEPREIHRLQDMKVFAPKATGTGIAWTTDGHCVLFEICSPDQPGPTELWRVPVEGGKPRKLLQMDGLKGISVHPDGCRIAFTGGWIQMEVWAMENFLILD